MKAKRYAIRKYAEAFEVVARTLSENSGFNATETISNLYAAHAKGTTNAGLDIEVTITFNFNLNLNTILMFVIKDRRDC